MNDYVIVNGELYHYGVKGMRWGHRKKYYNSDGSLNKLGQARQNYKTANRAYGRAYNKAYNYSAMRPIGQHLGKGKVKSDKLWDDAYDKLHDADKAKKSYKDAKKEYKEQKKAERNTPEAKAARKKAMIKAGVAIAGTALAAYGTYKVAKYMQDKRNQAAMNKAQSYINDNFMQNKGVTKYIDSTGSKRIEMDFYSPRAGLVTTKSYDRKDVGKSVGKHNAKVMATAKQMYKDSTNTKLDKGLAKVVNVGDRVGNAAKNVATKAKTTAKTTAKSAANKVLDVVNPIYEYERGSNPYVSGSIVKRRRK